MKAEQTVIDQLEACMDLMADGMPLEECLARYPEHAAELQGLLATANDARESLAATVVPNPDRLRSQVMAAWDREQALPRSMVLRRPWLPRFPFGMQLRGAAIAAALVIALLSGGTGTVAASASALPGDALYPVKEARERTQVFFAWSPEAKITAYTTLVRERTEEITLLAASGSLESSPIAATRLQAHVAEIGALLESGRVTESSQLTEVASAESHAENAVREAIPAAPENVRPSLEQALAVIDRASGRVDAALKDLRGGSAE